MGGKAYFNRIYAKEGIFDTLDVATTSYDLSVDGHFSSAIISTGYALMSSVTCISTATFGAATLSQSALSSAVISTGTAVLSSLTVVGAFTYSLSTTSTSVTFVSSINASTAGSSMINYSLQTMYIQRGVILNFSTVTSTSISQPA